MSSLSDFYSSSSWRKLRASLIAERTSDDGILYCEYSGEPILNEWEVVAHHEQPLTAANINDASIALNPENIKLVSHKSHNIIHKRFGHSSNSRKVYLVTGSPFAGKKTFVKNNKGNSDIVLDLDALWKAITMDDTLKPTALKSNVFGLREALLEQIRTRTGRWENAWVIMSLPRLNDRERYLDLLGAEEIHIDTEQDICLERADENGIKYVKDYWRDYIDTWTK